MLIRGPRRPGRRPVRSRWQACRRRVPGRRSRAGRGVVVARAEAVVQRNPNSFRKASSQPWPVPL